MDYLQCKYILVGKERGSDGEGDTTAASVPATPKSEDELKKEKKKKKKEKKQKLAEEAAAAPEEPAAEETPEVRSELGVLPWKHEF